MNHTQSYVSRDPLPNIYTLQKKRHKYVFIYLICYLNNIKQYGSISTVQYNNQFQSFPSPSRTIVLNHYQILSLQRKVPPISILKTQSIFKSLEFKGELIPKNRSYVGRSCQMWGQHSDTWKKYVTLTAWISQAHRNTNHNWLFK